MGRKIVIVLCLLLAAGNAWGANKYLWKDGNSGLECGASNIYFNSSWNCTGATGVDDIDAAIANAGIATDDVVIIDGSSAGVTYSGTDLDSDGNITISKRVHLRGCISGDIGFAEHGGRVTLSGGSTNVIMIYNNVANSTYSDLYMTGGSPTGTSQYQIRTDYGCTIKNINFSNGRTAILLFNGSSTVNNCSISTSSLSDASTGAVYAPDGSDGSVFNYCIFKDIPSTTAMYIRDNFALNNCVFYNIYGSAIISNAALGKTITINNPIFSAVSTIGYPISEGGSETIVVNNPILQGSSFNYGRVTSGSVTINNPLYTNPKFVSQRYPAILVFGVDDSVNWSYFQSVAAKLNAYGWGGTYALSSPATFTSYGTWADVATSINSGNEIAAHGVTYGNNLTDTAGIRVNYGGACGTGATGTVTSTGEVATNFSTSINGSVDKNVTITASMTLAQLVAAINGGSYTSSELNVVAGDPLAKYLADVVDKNICATNGDFSLDIDRVLDGEATVPKLAIESNLLAAGKTYTVNSFVCPGNDTSVDIRAGLLARNFTGSRGTAGGAPNTISNVNIFDIRSISAETLLGSEDPTLENVQIRLHGLTEYLKANGGIAFVFAHSTTGTDAITLAAWDKLLSETQKSDVQVMTLGQAVAYLKTYSPAGDVSTADSLTYTRTMVDALDMRLSANSPAIDAGFAWQTKSQAETAGVTVYGAAPDIGAYEFRKIESTIVPRPIIFDAPQAPCVSTNAACYVQ